MPLIECLFVKIQASQLYFFLSESESETKKVFEEYQQLRSDEKVNNLKEESQKKPIKLSECVHDSNVPQIIQLEKSEKTKDFQVNLAIIHFHA